MIMRGSEKVGRGVPRRFSEGSRNLFLSIIMIQSACLYVLEFVLGEGFGTYLSVCVSLCFRLDYILCRVLFLSLCTSFSVCVSVSASDSVSI